jgi:hypothetical protein
LAYIEDCDMGVKSMRRFYTLFSVLIILILAGCASYYSGDRYDQKSKQNIQYLRSTIVKKDTRGTFYLSVRYIDSEDAETIYLVIEHKGQELLYIRQEESLRIRGIGVDIRLSQDKKRRVRRQLKNEVEEQSFFAISRADYKKVVSSRETTATLITAKQPVRFPLPSALKVSMRRFFQEHIE